MRLLWFALKNLKHNRMIHVLIFLQVTVCFVITIAMTSSIISRWEYYEPFKKELIYDGYFYNMFYASDPDTGDPNIKTSEIRKSLQGNPKIIASYLPWLELHNERGTEFNVISLDTEWIQMYQPETNEGTWFSADANEKNGYIPIVVSENGARYHAGDVVEFEAFGYENVFQCEIIGVLPEGQQILSCTMPVSEAFTCKNLYFNYYYSIEEQPLFIFPQEYLEEIDVVTELHGPMFVLYNDETTKDMIDSNHQYLVRCNNIYTCTLESIRTQSIAYIFSQCKSLLPILISILILTTVSGMSVNALSAKRQIRNYAIYYICGSQWKSCVQIHVLSSALVAGSSLLITLFGLFLIKTCDLFSNILIYLSPLPILMCFAVLFIYLLFSLLLPFQILRHNEPVQVLKKI